MDFREAISDASRRKMINYLLNIFINHYDKEIGDTTIESSLQTYMLEILKLHKLPYDDHKCLTELKQVITLIRDIHNVLVGDSGNYYKFSCIHLEDLFILYKNILLQSNVLN